MHKKFLTALGAFVFVFAHFAFSQAPVKEVKVWQLSGLVVNRGSEEPVPFATIRINHSRRGMICNTDGFYSLPVVETDTVFFRSLGYHEGILVVADYMKAYQGDKNSPYIYAIHYLDEDSIVLKPTVIYPYSSPGVLKTAMISNRSPQYSMEQVAMGNMDPQTLDSYIKTLEADAGERALVAQKMYYQQYQTQNVAPVMPLFDPVAVYRLLKMINDKSKSKKDKDLNYWED